MYVLQLTITKGASGQGDTLPLPANATSHTQCGLDPGSVYSLKVTSKSGSGSGIAATLQVMMHLSCVVAGGGGDVWLVVVVVEVERIGMVWWWW